MIMLTGPDLEQCDDPRVIEEVLERLRQSAFRRRKRLIGGDLEYLRERGIDEVMRHAREFVAERLVPAWRPDDGRQTPCAGHPVFVAQHATATCCRGCLQTWHAIPRGGELSEKDGRYVLRLIGAWLSREAGLTVVTADPEAERAAGAAKRRARLAAILATPATNGPPPQLDLFPR
jgi:predicted Fe-S protein YdhL (DUF1289 family)